MQNSKKFDSNLLNAVLYIVVGVLFCIFRAGLLNWMLTIAGIVFIVLGVIDIIKKSYTSGAISAGIGAIIILGGWLFMEIVLLIFGILLIVKGVISLVPAIQAKDKVVVDIVFAALTMAAGIMLVISKWAMLDIFFIVIGAVLIINGAMELIGKFAAKK